MRQKIFLPEEVKNSISTHIYSSTAKAVEEYLSGNEDEDSLTGDLGATLRIKDQRVNVLESQVSGIWTWSITYYKFRGRGKGATENLVGADGIFELNLIWGKENVQKKCVLFQAKNQWRDTDKSLLEQSIKLSNWREASFILNYAPNNYEAFFIDEVIKAKGSRLQIAESIPLGAFLNRYFLECLIGDVELRYDASSRKLYWKTLYGEIISTKFTLKHKFAINITPPKREDKIREIKNTEISNFRMGVDEEEILSLPPTYTKKDVKVARKKLAQIYHTDYFNNIDEFSKTLLKRRLQEINHAYENLSSKPRK